MIQVRMKKVYFSESAGRHYLTKRAALQAEARAIIERKHPTERGRVNGDGDYGYCGWHWSSMPRANVMLRRLVRLISKSY